MKSQVKYSSIQVFKYRVYKLVITHYTLPIVNNVKSRDPIGSKNEEVLYLSISYIRANLCIYCFYALSNEDSHIYLPLLVLFVMVGQREERNQILAQGN